MVNCSRLSLKLVETQRVSGILQYIVEMSSVQHGKVQCLKLANFRQISQQQLELLQFTLLRLTNLWRVVILKVWFTSDAFQVVEINFCQTCQICFISTMLMTEKS